MVVSKIQCSQYYVCKIIVFFAASAKAACANKCPLTSVSIRRQFFVENISADGSLICVGGIFLRKTVCLIIAEFIDIWDQIEQWRRKL